MNQSAVNSRHFFRTHWRYWLVLGYVREPRRYQLPYSLYSTCISLIIIVLYPGTVFVALFNSTNLTDILQALPLCAASLSGSFKYISYYRRLQLVRELEKVFSNLDARIRLTEDRKYFADLQRRTDFIINTFRTVCAFFFAVTIISFVMSIAERRLVFALALPFDYRSSTKAYITAVGIELWLLIFDLLQSLVSDSFPAIALCVLSDHAHLLGKRLARIGYNCEDTRANVAELQRCVIDHQHLYRLNAMVQQIISIPVFIQYAVTAFQDCFTLIIFIFFTNTALDRLLFFIYLLALQLQIFPTCYYGSVCTNSMSDLQHRIYTSNWVEQDQIYRRLMSIFSERNLKGTVSYAAGLIPIHLSAFLKTIQGAYTFYSFVQGVRN